MNRETNGNRKHGADMHSELHVMKRLHQFSETPRIISQASKDGCDGGVELRLLA